MRNATRITVSTFGVLAGLAGLEHGLGEALQGNVAPDGMMIASWSDSELFRIVAGEPAMTIIPNLLITGILAILCSLAFLAWVTLFIHKKNGGLVLILLSFVLLLVGGGFGPPLLGTILGVTATRINAPLTWWRTHLPAGLKRFLGALWPWSFAVCLIAWLYMFPGSILLDYFLGVGNEMTIPIAALLAFGSLLLTIVAGFASDSQWQADSQQAPSMMSGRPVSQVGS
jgi:hypothetical protein